MKKVHTERHLIKRIGWLRAAVLGANDGIISISSLLIGVAAAHTSPRGILIAGIAGLIAGAMSMAAGEYISVSSQADIEKADILREKMELETDHAGEVKELMAIYVGRGLKPQLAEQVAIELMEHDALGAHARDELGISPTTTAKPFQAAFSSACSFTIGSLLPLLVVILTPSPYLIPTLLIMTIIFLASLGATAAKFGGSPLLLGATRVTLWGSLAMLVTAGIGSFLGVAI
jgi:VIT1/CCC1 family predicted Fe2+/Mn2+ transporter